MKATVSFPTKLKPIFEPYRYKILYGGRGSGKSYGIAQYLILKAVESKVRILCTRQMQNSIQESVHKLLSQQIERMGMLGQFTITRDRIVCNTGSEFIFKGILHNVAEIKSLEGVTYCWIEESENITENSWDIITPTIRKEGSEILASFNTRSKLDFLYKTFVVDTPPPESLVIKINFDDNPWFPEVLRKQMLHMKETDLAKYMNIWRGEPRTNVQGGIFTKQLAIAREQERMLNIPVQSNCEVNIYADLGKNDESAFWFVQRVGKEVHLIDYYEATGEEVSHYVKFMKDTGYNIGTLFLPHDGSHKRLGMHRTIEEQFRDGGIYSTEIVERIPQKQTAIELARELFPNCHFHVNDDERGVRVELGLNHLSEYHYKMKQQDNVFQLRPNHTRASNCADAFEAIAQSNELQQKGKYSDWGVSVN